MRVNTDFSNFIHNIFYKCSYIAKCCKSSEDTLVSKKDKNINQRYITLLDKEYSTLIYNKSRDKTKFINRAINEWELLLYKGFQNTDLESFQNKQRHSRFGTSDGAIYFENFFMPLSKSIYDFIKTTTISFEDKIDIIRYAIRRMYDSECCFTEEQINFISEIFIVILDYTYLNSYINNSIKLDHNTDHYLDIHNLFINGSSLYKDLNSYKLNLNNKGPFVFDYNYRSIERCTRAFCYMLHNRVSRKNTRVTLKELQDTNAILGGKKLPNSKTQFIKLNHKFNIQIINMLNIGYISCLVYNGKNWVRYNKQQLENLISIVLQSDIYLDEFDTVTESYRLSKNHFDSNNFNVSKKYLEDLDIMCNTKNLHQVLSGIDKTCLLKHNFYITANDVYLNVSYIYDIPKLDIVEKLLDSYYKILENNNQKKDIIRLATWICCSLETIQPFHNANSRTLFYILLPILLYENNIWLTRTLYNNWENISLLSSPEKYNQILQLCTNLPQIDLDFTWDYHISLNEKFRISCAIGDVNGLRKIFEQKPHMLGAEIFISPSKPQINAVEFALLYGQKEVAKFLLGYDHWKLNKQYLINMHNIYKNKDTCYYNKETDDFLEEYISSLP
jgi:hypothetical protein